MLIWTLMILEFIISSCNSVALNLTSYFTLYLISTFQIISSIRSLSDLSLSILIIIYTSPGLFYDQGSYADIMEAIEHECCHITHISQGRSVPGRYVRIRL